MAASIGFLIGRTREAASQSPRQPKAGIRDFMILALTGGLCACVREIVLTSAVLIAATSFLFLMRMHSIRGSVWVSLWFFSWGLQPCFGYSSKHRRKGTEEAFHGFFFAGSLGECFLIDFPAHIKITFENVSQILVLFWGMKKQI